MKMLALFVLFFSARLCNAQEPQFLPVCRAKLNLASHSRFGNKAGSAVYISCEGKARGNIFTIDSMDFMVIRNRHVVDQETMFRTISIELNEKVIGGDVVVYSNLRSKLNLVYRRGAISIEVPERKNY